MIVVDASIDNQRAQRLRTSMATTSYATCSQFESSVYDFYHYP
jgi:hypothetical protein